MQGKNFCILTTLSSNNMSYQGDYARRCMELFEGGKLAECAKTMEQAAGTCFDQRQKWINDCNILVCRFVNTVNNMPEDRSLLHLELVMNKILAILVQLRGTTATLSTLSIELAVTYDYCALQLYVHSDGVMSAISKVQEELVISITRAMNAMKKKTNGRPVLMKVEKEMVDMATYCLESRKAQESPGFLHAVACCCSLLGLTLVFQGCFESAERILCHLYYELDYTTLNIKDLPFILPFDCGEMTLSKPNNLKKIVGLYLAWNHLSQKNYTKCAQVAAECASGVSKTVLGCFQAFAHMKLGEPEEALAVLSTLTSPTDTAEMKAVVAYLQGNCLAMLGKGHSAIQKYKVAIQLDISSLAPLYNVAMEYRKMANFDAEIESLDLLVTGLEKSEESKKNRAAQKYWKMPLQSFDFIPRVSLPEILYIMAKRCMELEKFQISAERYLDLIALLVDDDSFNTLEAQCHQLDAMPSIRKIFLEATCALVKCERYEEAIVLCDRLTQKYTPASASVGYEHGADKSKRNGETQVHAKCLDGGPGNQIHSLPVQNSRKRQRSTEELESNNERAPLIHELCEHPYSEDIPALMYKSDCLVHLKNEDEALQLLNRVISSMEHASQHLSVEHSDTLLPKQKRMRLDSDGTQASQDSSKRSVPSHFQLLAQAYSRKAKLLVTEVKLKDALHFFRLGLSAHSESEDIVYNHSTLLVKMGNAREGYYNWLNFRNIDVKIDGFQIQHLINKTQNKLRDLELSTLDQKQRYALDKDALDYLLKQRHKI